MTENSDSNQIQWLLNAATVVLNPISDTAKLDAELLLCHLLDCNRTYLMTWPDKTLEPSQVESYQTLLKRREQGEPIAHITGYREFWTLNLEVNPSTLIPRPDTEVLVETALSVVDRGMHNLKTGLDLGTGTGAIALSLASELSDWQWLGVDYSEQAVALAERNAKRNNISNCSFKQSDWFSGVAEQSFDLIVSNPPYIDPKDQHLGEGDVRFEPLSALVAEDHGMADLRLIIEQSRNYLSPNGVLLLEHGYDQGEAVRALLNENGFQQVKTFTDLGSNDRVSIGYF